MLTGCKDACLKQINKQNIEITSEFCSKVSHLLDSSLAVLFSCQPNLVKLYYGLIDLIRGSKVFWWF